MDVYYDYLLLTCGVVDVYFYCYYCYYYRLQAPHVVLFIIIVIIIVIIIINLIGQLRLPIRCCCCCFLMYRGPTYLLYFIYF